MKKHLYAIVIIYLFLAAFTKKEFAGFRKPANFPEPVHDFKKYPVTIAGFELGRQLFYESAFSRDNTISCGNCHVQSSGFTQHGHDLSHGIDDQLGTRNSPPIMNLAWSKSFMWDGGVIHLDIFPLTPITNPVEMDEKMANVIAKLKVKGFYLKKFRAAYGDTAITGKRVFDALTQYMLMCVSSDSKYDSVMRSSGPQFTMLEKNGYLIFKRDCSGCHKEPLFTDGSFRNNGLDQTYNQDVGRQAITLDAKDRYKFKVPSLRNNKYTAPYMHDGRFTTIDQVLDHYDSKIKPEATLDPLLQKHGIVGIHLTTDDKVAIKAFLNTLNDTHFITRTDLSENHENSR